MRTAVSGFGDALAAEAPVGVAQPAKQSDAMARTMLPIIKKGLCTWLLLEPNTFFALQYEWIALRSGLSGAGTAPVPERPCGHGLRASPLVGAGRQDDEGSRPHPQDAIHGARPREPASRSSHYTGLAHEFARITAIHINLKGKI
jgi:hypothetical protein